jgi:hypothetical protein
VEQICRGRMPQAPKLVERQLPPPPPPKTLVKRKPSPAVVERKLAVVERKLEWSGNNLYVLHGKQKWYVGTVVRRAFAPIWTVWIRGGIKLDFNSEEASRRQLEDHAQLLTRLPRAPEVSRARMG